jgi:hypothetical protein
MNSKPQWHFVGSVPENYERYLVPGIFVSWAEDLVEMAALRPGERVLDIAVEPYSRRLNTVIERSDAELFPCARPL